jgi:hypothetical protein
LITNLDESDISCLFSEALSADVETVFPDETSLVGTDTAAKPICQQKLVIEMFHSHRENLRGFLPGSGSFAVRPRTGVPDCLVRHAASGR